MRPIVFDCKLDSGKLFLQIVEIGRKTWQSAKNTNVLNLDKYQWHSIAVWDRFWHLMEQRSQHMHFMPEIKAKREPEKHRRPKTGPNGQPAYEVQRVRYVVAD
jgi:hypothetical protein